MSSTCDYFQVKFLYFQFRLPPLDAGLPPQGAAPPLPAPGFLAADAGGHLQDQGPDGHRAKGPGAGGHDQGQEPPGLLKERQGAGGCQYNQEPPWHLKKRQGVATQIPGRIKTDQTRLGDLQLEFASSLLNTGRDCLASVKDKPILGCKGD